jgi:hypothetical protein
LGSIGIEKSRETLAGVCRRHIYGEAITAPRAWSRRAVS